MRMGVLCAVTCWLIPVVLGGLITLFTGGPWDLSVRPEVAAVLDAGRNQELTDALQATREGDLAFLADQGAIDISAAVVSSLACLASVLIIQMMFSLLAHPVVGLMANMAVLFFSAYFTESWLPGNYLMLARTDVLMRGGMQPWEGVLLACVICLVLIIAGGVIFSRRDLMGRKDMAS